MCGNESHKLQIKGIIEFPKWKLYHIRVAKSDTSAKKAVAINRLSQALKPDTIRVVVSLSELGSVRRAADALNMTPSAVSKHLKRIEQGAGRTLFDRNHDGLTPNEEGLAFVTYAERFLALASELGDRFGQDVLTGTVRLGVTDDVGLARIPQLLRMCKVAHPKISVELVVDFSSELIKAADARLIDIAILSDGGPAFPEAAQQLAPEPLVWAKKTDFVLSEAVVPLVLSTQGCRWRARSLEALSDAGMKHRIYCTSPSTAGQLSGVQLGLGIAPLPVSVIKDVPGVSLEREQFPDLGQAHLALYQTAPDNLVLKSVREAVQRMF